MGKRVGGSCAAALGCVWCVAVLRLAASQVKPCDPSSVAVDALGCCTWLCWKVRFVASQLTQ